MKTQREYKQKEVITKVDEPSLSYSYKSYDDSGVFRIMDAVNLGINFRNFFNFTKKFPFSMQEWADLLHISSKTLSRYQKEEKTFDAVQSEKIIQIQILYARGEDVFGSSDNFMIWLQTESLALGRKKPQYFLGNSFGINFLMDELTRIEHGVLA